MIEDSVIENDESEDSEEESESTEELNKNEEQETESSSEESEEGEEEDEAKLTEKGTKLDPDPKSAVHQELANANKRIHQMETVLGDPNKLANYARQSGLTVSEAKAEIEEQKDEVEKFDPEKLKTSGDVAEALNTMQEKIASLSKENKSLKDGYDGISRSSQVDRVASTMQRDITSVREKYPELNPKNKDYDKDLEKEIGELYHELDFDETTQGYRGRVSIARLTDKVMKAAGRARKQGSQQAQTDVRVKKAGKVVTSSKGKAKESESDDPGTTIAQRISKAYGG